MPNPEGRRITLTMVWLYAVILLLLAAALWGAYRVLGTPSRLAPRDYDVVLDDIKTSVERAASRLRRALDATRRSACAPRADRIGRLMNGPRSAGAARPMTGPAGCSAARASTTRWCWKRLGA
jgi:hypothetical protein